MIKIYLKKIYQSLQKEVFPTWFRALYSLFILSIGLDYAFTGKLGYIAFLRFEINNTLLGEKLAFILFIIIIFLIWRRK